MNDPSSMTQGQIFVISAPSGGGKSTVSKALLGCVDGLGLSISHTTRKKRPGEHDGQHYHFVDDETFDRLVAEDAFIEWAWVYGKRYGTSKEAIKHAEQQGHDIILELDPQGAHAIKALHPEATLLFILPPSLTSLAERLQRRCQDDMDTIRYRLRKAKEDIAQHIHFDYIIVNSDIEETIDQCSQILMAQRLTMHHQSNKNKLLINRLLKEPIPEVP